MITGVRTFRYSFNITNYIPSEVYKNTEKLQNLQKIKCPF